MTGGDYLADPEILVEAFVNYTISPSKPIPVISGPSNVYSTCGSQTLTFTSSKSSGIASATFSYSWTTTLAANYGIMNGYNTGSLTITNFNGVSSFNVTLTITNIFNLYESVSYPVTVSGNTGGLSVSLDISQPYTMKKSDSIKIQASIINFCGTSGTASYAWTFTPSSTSITKYKNQFLIPSNSLATGSYNLSVTATLTEFSGNVLLGSLSAIINIIGSDPVASVNRIDSQIGKNVNYYAIDGSSSYDPDNPADTLIYLWYSSLSGFQNQTTSSIKISPSLYSSVFSFNVTLQVTTKDGRTASITRNFVAINKIYTDLFVVAPTSKVSPSQKLRIDTSIQAPPGISYYKTTAKWKLFSGKSITIKPSDKSFLAFSANSLVGGTTYSFQLTLTANSVFSYTFLFIHVNAGAACPSNSASSTPLTGTISTIFTFSISGCYDRDGEDYPLQYSYGYISGNSKRINKLSITTQGSIIYIPLQVGTSTVVFTVCDYLSECTNNNAPSVTVSGSFRNLKTDDKALSDQYKQYTQKHDLILGLTNMLVAFTIPEELLTTMWNDFVDYMQNQKITIHTIQIIDSIIFLFMDDLQIQSLTYEKLKIYADYLANALSELDAIGPEEEKIVIDIADRILDISTDISYVLLSQKIVSSLLKFNDVQFDDPYIQKTSHISVYNVEDFMSEINKDLIDLETVKITIGDLGLAEDRLVAIESVAYSPGKYADYLYINLTTYESYVNHELVQSEYQQLTPLNGSVLVSLPVFSSNELECVVYTNQGWKHENCEILESKENVTLLNIKASGFYTLMPVETKASLLPFYIVLCLILLSAVVFPIMIYLNKMKPYLLVSKFSLSIDSKTDRGVSPTEIESIIENREKSSIQNHLLLSIIKSKGQQKFEKFMLLIANIVAEILLENLLLKETSLNAQIIGIVSALMMIPFSGIILFFFNSFKQRLAFVLIGIVYILSLMGTFLIKSQAGWETAFIIGLVSETFVAETFIMIASKI